MLLMVLLWYIDEQCCSDCPDDNCYIVAGVVAGVVAGDDVDRMIFGDRTTVDSVMMMIMMMMMQRMVVPQQYDW